MGVGGFIYANQFLQISSLLPSGNIYGIGEHQDSMRHSMNWQRLTLFAHDELPAKGKNLYGSHPFYLVMENSGFSHGVFLKNSDPMEIILQPAPAITFRVLGGVLDFYFFLGPTPEKVDPLFMLFLPCNKSNIMQVLQYTIYLFIIIFLFRS